MLQQNSLSALELIWIDGFLQTLTFLSYCYRFRSYHRSTGHSSSWTRYLSRVFLQCLTAFLARAGLSKVSPIVSMRKNFFFEIDKYFDILTYSTFKHNELLKSSTQKKSSYPISVLRTIVLPYKGSENLRFQRSLLFMIIIILITNLAQVQCVLCVLNSRDLFLQVLSQFFLSL